MHIAFVCHEYPPLPHGGIGTFVETVARGLQRRQHAVTVVGFGERDCERMQDGVCIVELRRSRLKFIGNLLSRIKLRNWLRKQVRLGELDVVEVPDFQGSLPFSLNGCAVVVRLHLSFSSISLQAGREASRGIAFYEKCTLRNNPNWIGVSQCILDITQNTFKLQPTRSVVIYNSVPTLPTIEAHIPELPPRFVLYAGQLSHRKGALVLAEAACEFMRFHPDVHLVYVGGVIERDGKRPIADLIHSAVGCGLASRIHFLGHQSRNVVIECMKRGTVFAFPSQLEALPLVVLEAMSCGLPVVCTSHPPGPEMVEDGFNGLLADPLSARSLSEKISLLLSDSALAARLAANAKIVIEDKFSLEKCLDRSEQFYLECIASGQKDIRPRSSR